MAILDLFNIPKKVNWAIITLDKNNESFLKSLNYTRTPYYTKIEDTTHFSFNFSNKKITAHQLSEEFIKTIQYDKDKIFLNAEEFKQLLLIQGMN